MLKFSKKRIDRAGEHLITLTIGDPLREKAIEIVDYWRSCHSYPLQAVKTTLSNRAKRLDKTPVIAQRLKRKPSIIVKLQDNPNMKLSQMQDLGGCRAILSNMRAVDKLADIYRASVSQKGEKRTHIDPVPDDYVTNPKQDGYRSIHFVLRFHSSSTKSSFYNGQRVEVQIRTRLQHAWATAVETAQLFTGQALKSNKKRASKEWLRFFALASGAFACRERTSPVPGLPENQVTLLKELYELAHHLKVFTILPGWAKSLEVIQEKQAITSAKNFVLRLDTGRRLLRVMPFDKELSAQSCYDDLERMSQEASNIDVVLVKVEDVHALKSAFPNYHVDTKNFLSAIARELATIGKSESK